MDDIQQCFNIRHMELLRSFYTINCLPLLFKANYYVLYRRIHGIRYTIV